MAVITTDPASLVLTHAADLIETRGWDCTAYPYEPGQTTEPYAPDYAGGLSVRGALEVASRSGDWGSLGDTDAGAVADDGMCALASYVTDTVFIPMYSAMVADCRACSQCREHTHRPLILMHDQQCPNGCVLCADHTHLTDPSGGHTLPTEAIIDTWEGYMPHQRDVVSTLRAAASRPAL